jgi:hypothetical protein
MKMKSTKDECGMCCNNCNAYAVVSQRTGKPYCPNWKRHKDKKDKYSLIPTETKNDKDFFDDMSI